MSPDDTTERIAALLAVHRLHPSMNMCTGCDWRPKHDHGQLIDQHERHRAAVLIANGIGDVTEAEREREEAEVNARLAERLRALLGGDPT